MLKGRKALVAQTPSVENKDTLITYIGFETIYISKIVIDPSLRLAQIVVQFGKPFL